MKGLPKVRLAAKYRDLGPEGAFFFRREFGLEWEDFVLGNLTGTGVQFLDS